MWETDRFTSFLFELIMWIGFITVFLFGLSGIGLLGYLLFRWIF